MKPLRNVIILTSAIALTLFPGCSEKEAVPSAEPERISPDSISFGWQAPYREKLASFAASEEYNGNSLNGAAFDLLDIDGDHSPELVISTGTSSSDVCRIYTFRNEVMEYLGEVCKGGKLEWLPDLDMFHDEYVGESFLIGNYYSMMDDEYTGTIAYTRNIKAVSGDFSTQTINGEEYLLPDFEKELEPYTSAYSIVRGRRFNFGEKAIDLALNCSESWGVALNIGERELYRNTLMEALEGAAEGSDMAFELCDLNSDGVPELVISEGAEDSSTCRIYAIIEGKLTVTEPIGHEGQVWYDVSNDLIFYPIDDLKWATASLTDEEVSSAVKPEEVTNQLVLGRQYRLTAENIEIALN